MLAEGVVIPRGGGREPEKEALQGGGPGGGPPRRRGRVRGSSRPTINREDFNPTLYSLDAREMEVLKAEVRHEGARDLRGDVLSALFDRLEEPDCPIVRPRSSASCGTLLPNFLSRGALAAAADVLRELRTLEEPDGCWTGGARSDWRMVVDELSVPRHRGELVRALEDGSIAPAPASWAGSSPHFAPGSPGPRCCAPPSWWSDKQLQDVLRECGEGHRPEEPGGPAGAVQGRRSGGGLAGAARLAGTMGITAGGPLRWRGSWTTRTGTSGSLRWRPRPRSRPPPPPAPCSGRWRTPTGRCASPPPGPWERCATAPPRRLSEEILAGKDIRAADLTEKIAFFEAYGAVGDAGSVRAPGQAAQRARIPRPREPSEIRACAALALGRSARRTRAQRLEAAAGEEDPVVRNAVSRALREETVP